MVCLPGYSVHQFIVTHVTHSIDFAVTAIEAQWRIYFLCSVNKKIKGKNLIKDTGHIHQCESRKFTLRMEVWDVRYFQWLYYLNSISLNEISRSEGGGGEGLGPPYLPPSPQTNDLNTPLPPNHWSKHDVISNMVTHKDKSFIKHKHVKVIHININMVIIQHGMFTMCAANKKAKLW